MRNLMIAAIAVAALAGTADAATTTRTKHHSMTSHRGAVPQSEAVKELNRKSLEQASATTPGGMPMAAPAGAPMNDSGSMAPAPGSTAAPMAPAAPAGDSMAPAAPMTPPTQGGDSTTPGQAPTATTPTGTANPTPQ